MLMLPESRIQAGGSPLRFGSFEGEIRVDAGCIDVLFNDDSDEAMFESQNLTKTGHNGDGESNSSRVGAGAGVNVVTEAEGDNISDVLTIVLIRSVVEIAVWTEPMGCWRCTFEVGRGMKVICCHSMGTRGAGVALQGCSTLSLGISCRLGTSISGHMRGSCWRPVKRFPNMTRRGWMSFSGEWSMPISLASTLRSTRTMLSRPSTFQMGMSGYFLSPRSDLIIDPNHGWVVVPVSFLRVGFRLGLHVCPSAIHGSF